LERKVTGLQGCKLQVAGYRVTGCKLQVAGYRLQVAGYRLQVAGLGLLCCARNNAACDVLVLPIFRR